MKKWKLEIHIPDIMIFLLKCISFYTWPQFTYLHTLLKTIPNCRTSWRSLFLPPLYCTHNWYFSHLWLLLKLSMKVFWNAWLHFMQNSTVNIFYQNTCTRTKLLVHVTKIFQIFTELVSYENQLSLILLLYMLKHRNLSFRLRNKSENIHNFLY